MSKGVNAVAANSDIFTKDEALSILGVGKNMVRSIRHWCLSAKLIEKIESKQSAYQLTHLGKSLFLEDGYDPYLEDYGTLWLLHWLISSDCEYNTTWYVVFSNLNKLEFTKRDIEDTINEFILINGYKKISEISIQRDIDCFIRTYIPSKSNKGFFSEDNLDCPLAELNLMYDVVDSDKYSFNYLKKPTIPEYIFLFILLSFWKNNFSTTETLNFETLTYSIGSPGKILKLNDNLMAYYLEKLEKLTGGILIYDETAGLKQVLKKGDINEFEILKEYYNTNVNE